MALVTTFLDPGSEATQDMKFWLATVGTVTSATDQVHTGTRSIKMASGAGPAAANLRGFDGVLADSGTQISFWFRFDAAPAATATVMTLRKAGAITNVIPTQLNTSSQLVVAPTGGTGSVTGATTLSTNTWYRICISYYVTSTSDYQIKVYLNGVLEITANNTLCGTMTNTATSAVFIGFASTIGTSRNYWYSDIYVATGGASSSSQPDTGDIRVTAKRPFANGTTNGFTGTGTPSGYGSGNATYVNQLPLSTTDFVSVIAAGATTEEYNIENRATGAVNLAGLALVDVGSWVYCKALISETASIILDNATSNISVTSANTMFWKYAGATTYPAGTGTDVGMITSADATTVTLYECGVLVAYIPAVMQRRTRHTKTGSRSS